MWLKKKWNPRDYVWEFLKESMGCWKGTMVKNKKKSFQNMVVYKKKVWEKGCGPI